MSPSSSNAARGSGLFLVILRQLVACLGLICRGGWAIFPWGRIQASPSAHLGTFLGDVLPHDALATFDLAVSMKN